MFELWVLIGVPALVVLLGMRIAVWIKDGK